jgi:type II secretory pathway component GspD/PulD (secretin)
LTLPGTRARLRAAKEQGDLTLGSAGVALPVEAGEGPSDLPVVSKRSVDTRLRVQNGETITVGGLTLKTENVRATGVPFLGRVPILGYLFEQETCPVEEREIVVFITPGIIED